MPWSCLSPRSYLQIRGGDANDSISGVCDKPGGCASGDNTQTRGVTQLVEVGGNETLFSAASKAATT